MKSRIYKKEDPLARFKRWVKITNHIPEGLTSPCHDFMQAHSGAGYVQFWYEGKYVLVHRWIYERKVGTIPAGMQIDHLCNRKTCVNVDHLRVVTPRVNTLRNSGSAARNARKTHCLNGHPLSEDNVYLHRRKRLCRICRRETSRESNARYRSDDRQAYREYCRAYYHAHKDVILANQKKRNRLRAKESA